MTFSYNFEGAINHPQPRHRHHHCIPAEVPSEIGSMSWAPMQSIKSTTYYHRRSLDVCEVDDAGDVHSYGDWSFGIPTFAGILPIVPVSIFISYTWGWHDRRPTIRARGWGRLLIRTVYCFPFLLLLFLHLFIFAFAFICAFGYSVESRFVQWGQCTYLVYGGCLVYRVWFF